MYIFFEKGTREGISYIFNRNRKASNKYLKSYDPKQESKHIIYLEANNLYGINNLYNLGSKDVFLELILNIQKNYTNYIIIIL